MTVFYKLQKTTGGLPINSKMKVMPVRQIAVDFESLAQKISVGTTFSSADLIGALEALKEAMIAELKEGGRVHLPGFGYFSLSIKGEVYQNAKTQRYRLRSPRIRKIKFLPERTLMKRLADTHFANVGSTSSTSKPLSEREIDNALRLLFAQQQVLTVGQLQDYLHLRHTFAYRLVKNLEMKGKIRNIGSAHRKVFVPGEVLNVPSEQ